MVVCAFEPANLPKNARMTCPGFEVVEVKNAPLKCFDTASVGLHMVGIFLH